MLACYTGVGARSTPPSDLAYMRELAKWLAPMGFVMRSGAAAGADSAFEEGALEAGGKVEIYLPWKGFNKHPSPLCKPTWHALEYASGRHPAWDRCKQGARKLHARNVHQLAGMDLTRPQISSFLVCWTPGGEVVGGTGMAIRIAKSMQVPVYNIAIPGMGRALTDYIEENVV